MKTISETKLNLNQAAFWFLGQAGFIFCSVNVTVAVDPYLSDSVGKVAPDFARQIPVPLAPEELKVDYFIVTHNHLDHLDPETIGPYRHKESTIFIAPRLAAAKLRQLDLPEKQIIRIDSGESRKFAGVTISGVFSLGTSPEVIDTTGYHIEFANGRSVYHAADTAYTALLLQAAPKNIDILITPINGKFGNLNIEQAIELAKAVQPKYVIPCHFDLMALNAENPESFRWFCRERKVKAQCIIAQIMQPFIWE